MTTAVPHKRTSSQRATLEKRATDQPHPTSHTQLSQKGSSGIPLSHSHTFGRSLSLRARSTVSRSHVRGHSQVPGECVVPLSKICVFTEQRDTIHMQGHPRTEQRDTIQGEDDSIYPRRSWSGSITPSIVQQLSESASDVRRRATSSLSQVNKELSKHTKRLADGSEALHALEESIKWLCHLPAGMGIIFVMCLQDIELEHATLARPHQLKETTNFLVAAVAFAPILATSVFWRILVIATQMACQQVADGTLTSPLTQSSFRASARAALKEGARWLPVVTYCGLCLKLLLVDLRGCSATAAARHFWRWRALLLRRHPPSSSAGIEPTLLTDAAGMCELANTGMDGAVLVLLAGLPLLCIIASFLGKILTAILAAGRAAIPELQRAHEFVRLLYVVQVLCFCFVLVTAWSSPLLVPPVAYHEDENPCQHLGRLYLLRRCRPSRELHGPPTICRDGGYSNAYASAQDACTAARSQDGFLATTYSAVMLSLNALLALIFRVATHHSSPPPTRVPDEWKGLEFTWLFSWLFGMISALCCAVYLSVLLSARQGAHIPMISHALARLHVQTLNIASWMAAMALLTAPVLTHKRCNKTVTARQNTGKRQRANECVLVYENRTLTLEEAFRKHALKTKVVGAWQDGRARAAEKFIATEFRSADARLTALGLEKRLGISASELSKRKARGVDAIREEIERNGTADDQECLEYVLHREAGSSDRMFDNSRFPRDCDEHGVRADRKHNSGARAGQGYVLADFVSHPEAVSSDLSEAEVLALRLYTTWAFQTINSHLRKAISSGGVDEPHPLPCTVSFLEQAIKKLRTTHIDRGQATEEIDRWRGLKDRALSVSFGCGGGPEVAPMSTTRNWEVALGYSMSRAPLIFKIRSTCFANRGADISFLSAFPAEQEFLYPPLTFLKTGWTEDISLGEHGTIKLVEVEPSLS